MQEFIPVSHPPEGDAAKKTCNHHGKKIFLPLHATRKEKGKREKREEREKRKRKKERKKGRKKEKEEKRKKKGTKRGNK
jgi:hypothetical protein